MFHDVGMTETPDQRVGRYVRERREELGLNQGQRKPSPAIWGQVENAKDVSHDPKTFRTICKALRWTPESIDLIREGKEPVEIPDPPQSAGPTLPDRVEQVRSSMNRLIDELATMVREAEG